MDKLVSCQLGDLIEFQRGYDLPRSEFVEGEYPVQSSNGILGYHNEYKVEAPGITIGRSGTVGIPHLLRKNFFPHNTALFVKDFKGNDVEYIYYLLHYLDLGNQKSGSGVPTMNRNHLHPLKIKAYTDLETQQKIAQVLSTLDRKIALNQQINAELEKMAKTLYDYWFVQFDFPDENGNPYKSSGGEMVYNPELKRNVPKGWGVKKLSEHLDCNRKKLGKNHRLSFINYLDTSNLTNNKIDDVQFLKADKGKIPSRANMIVSHNDILFSTVRPNQNHFGLIKNPIENLIGSTGFAVLSHKENSALNSIFYLCITSKNNLQKLISISESATSSYPSINNNDILNLLICLPKDICILEKLAEIFDSIFEKQSIVEKENKKLTQLRDFLLPMLMNGQVEVV